MIFIIRSGKDHYSLYYIMANYLLLGVLAAYVAIATASVYHKPQPYGYYQPKTGGR